MEMIVTKNATPLGTTQMGSDPRSEKAREIPGASKVKLSNKTYTPPIVLRIGSWNVGTMNHKSYQLEDVMIRRRLGILCVQETKWRNQGNKSRYLDTRTKRYKIHYHGIENHRNGVGIILSDEHQKNIIGIRKVSDRLMSIKLVIGKEIWNIISAYAPQIGCNVTEKGEFWLSLENLLKEFPLTERVYIGADLNGHVGANNRGNKRWHGGFGYGTRNEQGDEIVQLAKSHNYAILNTFFKKQSRHLITYSSGGRETQIDYHLCSNEIRKYVKDCKVILGEDAVDQHRLLLSEIRLPTPKQNKDTAAKVNKIRWHKLKDPEGERYLMEMEELMQDVINRGDTLDADGMWQLFQGGSTGRARALLGVSKGKLNIGKESWFWKGEAIKKAVAEKKAAFRQWSKCSSSLVDEKERLRKLKNETKKAAAKEVAKAKAMECQKFYEDLESPEGSGAIYKIAAQRRNNGKPITSPKFIENANGELLTNDRDITEGWKSYFDTLLNEEFPRNKYPTCDPVLNEVVEDITATEVETAVKEMKNGRSTGPDEIPTEFWKSVGATGIIFLCILFNKIKNGNPMPRSFRESFLLPFYKNKGDSRKCTNYRAIKLLSHTMKIWERVINNRVLKIVLPKIHAHQCGFVPGRSTVDAIQAMRILVEKFRDAAKDLHIIFIDLEKAFDRIPRDLIWAALRSHGVPEQYVQIIMDMYKGVTTRIRCTSGTSAPFFVLLGVHQGSVLSPLLFNIVLNFLTSGIMQELLLSLLFADDVGLASERVSKLQGVFDKWKQILEDHGLRVSESKTEYMFLPFSDPQAPSPDIMINGNVMQKCTSFKYLGSILNILGTCDEDANHRVSVGWLKWQQNSGVLCDKRMPPKLKGKIYTTVVRPALTYGSKCWTMYDKFGRDLTTAEMKMCRMSLGVTKLDHIKSERIRGALHIKEAIVDKVRNERNDWFAKVHSQNETNVAKKVLMMDIPQGRKRGRPKNSWAGQMRQQQQRHGLTQEERDEIASARPVTRSMGNERRS